MAYCGGAVKAGTQALCGDARGRSKMSEDLFEPPKPNKNDVLEAYLAREREDLSKPEDVMDQQIIIASAVCPVCEQANIVQPRHLSVLICRGCGEPLVVMLAPCKFAEASFPLVSFQVRSKDNSWSWVFDPRKLRVDQFLEVGKKE